MTPNSSATRGGGQKRGARQPCRQGQREHGGDNRFVGGNTGANKSVAPNGRIAGGCTSNKKNTALNGRASGGSAGAIKSTTPDSCAGGGSASIEKAAASLGETQGLIRVWRQTVALLGATLTPRRTLRPIFPSSQLYSFQHGCY